MSVDLGEVSDTELIEELLSRQIDWRFYKKVADNYLAEVMEQYNRDEAERLKQWRARHPVEEGEI